MSFRTRSRNVPTVDEQELYRQLGIAEQALLRSAAICKQMERGQDRVASRRSQAASQVIKRAVQAISNIGSMTSGIDSSDPDLMSEKELTAISREKRNARLEKARQAGNK